MPPEDEPQPSFQELESVIGELTEGLFKARKALASKGGKVDMRRLNRREFAGTIRHLFGMEPKATDIPQDRDVENFDTVGARQVYTTEHFDLYYELDRKILSQGFKWAGVKQEVETKIQEPEAFWNSNFRRFMEINKNAKEGTKSHRLNKQREDYFKFPHYETGVYLSEPLRHLKFGHSIDPRGSYRFSIKAGLQGNVHPLRRFIKVTGHDGPLDVFRVEGSAESPSYSEIEVQPRQLEERFSRGVGEDRTGAWHSHYINFLVEREILILRVRGIFGSIILGSKDLFTQSKEAFLIVYYAHRNPNPAKTLHWFGMMAMLKS